MTRRPLRGSAVLSDVTSSNVSSVRRSAPNRKTKKLAPHDPLFLKPLQLPVSIKKNAPSYPPAQDESESIRRLLSEAPIAQNDELYFLSPLSHTDDAKEDDACPDPIDHDHFGEAFLEPHDQGDSMGVSFSFDDFGDDCPVSLGGGGSDGEYDDVPHDEDDARFHCAAEEFVPVDDHFHFEDDACEFF